MMGYDALFFEGSSDSHMIAIAMAENRVVLTRDTQIVRRRIVTNGQLEAVLIQSDEPERQMRQVMGTLKLDFQFRPFSICLECNQQLLKTSKDVLHGVVPPFVYKTHDFYMECPSCHRIYWRGSHWEVMKKKLEEFSANRWRNGG